MLPIETHDEMRRMRVAGYTLEQIGDKFRVGKGTVHYIVRGVHIPPEIVEDMDRRHRALAFHSVTPEERRLIGIRGGTSCQRQHGDRIVRNLTEGNGWEVSGLTYRRDELPILVELEKRFHTEFRKEQFGRLFIDFADELFLIEVTSDDTTGVTDALHRFEAVARTNDRRVRIAYVTPVVRSSPRRDRLRSLGVIVRDVFTLIGP